MPPIATPSVSSYDRLFIGGEWREPRSSTTISIVSPITEDVVGSVAAATEDDVDAAVGAARQAFDEGPWPKMAPLERARVLDRVIEELERRLPAMQASYTDEIGAPRWLSAGAHQMALTMWRDARSQATSMWSEQKRPSIGGDTTVIREPVGVVAGVLPWNAPAASASKKIAPALAAGCTVVLKLAEEGPTGALMLADVLAAAGVPPGVVSVLPADRSVSSYLVRHPGIDKVTFTGSTSAGRSVMASCADRIKRVTLELGGKSAGIVLDDADLDRAIPNLVLAGVRNSGQVCAAISRVLVSRQLHDEVIARMVAYVSTLRVGDPRQEDTIIGPLVSDRQRARVEEYIALGLQEGADLVVGGGRPAGLQRGWYVEPTIFAGVTNSMRVAREEIFGPVICVLAYDDVHDAVAIANDSDYGLSGSVWTSNPTMGRDVARSIRTGQVFINDASICIDQPFGGFKQSGLGRECGPEGFEAFLETKVVTEC